MNATEKTPVLTETLIETLVDLIQPEDQTGEDDLARDKSEWLLRQYTNATPDGKKIFDIVTLCLTDKSMEYIIAHNQVKNKQNANVG